MEPLIKNPSLLSIDNEKGLIWMSKEEKLISIITPVFNEEENVEIFYRTMCEVTNKIQNYKFEFVFTDNASSDSTFQILQRLGKQDKRVRAFRFSKNFGYQRSIYTGYTNARGEAVIEYDCDLQDPPELLPTFIKEWEKGHEIVYGIREKRSEGSCVTLLRRIFYRTINAIGEDELPHDAGDFLMIDRKIVEHLRDIHEQDIYLRGAIFSFGYKQIGIPYERRARDRGVSKFPFRKMLALAMDGIISHSIIPLRIASFVGISVAVLTLLLSVVYLWLKFFSGVNLPDGFTTTTILILFSISLNGIFFGIIGEYQARIYNNTKKRPMSIIYESINND